MINTEMLRTQHEGLLDVAQEVSTHLDATKLRQDAYDVRTLLSKLSGKLKVHLAMEDDSLYPRLLESPDESVRTTTIRYQNEMGNISTTFHNYMAKWRTAQPIQDDPHEFIAQTHKLFSALAERIEREDNELYPMID